MLSGLLESFKTKIKNEAVIGIFMKASDPAFVEVAGRSGMDYVILDGEHGPVGIENMQNLIRAAYVSGVLPIVRVPGTMEHMISQPLDIGAAGVQIPQVRNASDIRDAVAAAKFHPLGQRGVCRFVRAAGYSYVPRERYFAEANQTLVIAQLEGAEAIRNIDEILDAGGFDILFIGPYDLSQSLGVTGDVQNPAVVREMRKIVEKARAKDVTVGTFVDNAESLAMWKAEGVRYLSYSVDVGLFYDKCLEVVNTFYQLK